MSLVKQNIVANFLGRGYGAAISVLVVPVYIHFLGIEAYGLIGFSVTLLALTSVFDFGLATTACRELARLTVREGEEQEARDTVRTFELVYWCSAILLGAGAILAAEPISRHWLQVETLALGDVRNAIALLAVALAIQMPSYFYAGCLMGLQRQVLLNVINAVTITIQTTGAVLVLWLISSDISAFFIVQIVARALNTTAMAISAWTAMPGHSLRPRIQFDVIRRTWRFALGMSGVTVVGLLVTQVDSLIVSKLLPLSDVGYYSLARSVALVVLMFATPVFNAVLPAFSQYLANGDEVRLAASYHQVAQILSAVVVPAAMVFVFFPEPLLWAWTGDAATVQKTSQLVTLLALGAAINGIQHGPYALQLAFGWTKFPLFANLFALMFLIPSVVVCTIAFGAKGTAAAWLAMHAGTLVLAPPIMHRFKLREQMWRWYLGDILRPVAGALLFVIPCSMLFPTASGRGMSAGVIGLAFCLAATGAVTSIPWLRIRVVAEVRSWFFRHLDRSRATRET